MLPTLKKISTQQSKPTKHTITKFNFLLDYAGTYPNAIIWYHPSDMILHGDTDADNLVISKDHNRIAGHFYLSDHLTTNYIPKQKPNGAILNICQTLKKCVAWTSEMENGGMFLNRQVIFSDTTPYSPWTTNHQTISPPSSPTAKLVLASYALSWIQNVPNPKTWDNID